MKKADTTQFYIPMKKADTAQLIIWQAHATGDACGAVCACGAARERKISTTITTTTLPYLNLRYPTLLYPTLL